MIWQRELQRFGEERVLHVALPEGYKMTDSSEKECYYIFNNITWGEEIW